MPHAKLLSFCLSSCANFKPSHLYLLPHISKFAMFELELQWWNPVLWRDTNVCFNGSDFNPLPSFPTCSTCSYEILIQLSPQHVYPNSMCLDCFYIHDLDGIYILLSLHYQVGIHPFSFFLTAFFQSCQFVPKQSVQGLNPLLQQPRI